MMTADGSGDARITPNGIVPYSFSRLMGTEQENMEEGNGDEGVEDTVPDDIADLDCELAKIHEWKIPEEFEVELQLPENFETDPASFLTRRILFFWDNYGWSEGVLKARSNGKIKNDALGRRFNFSVEYEEGEEAVCLSLA